jgi:hypothetical protein
MNHAQEKAFVVTVLHITKKQGNYLPATFQTLLKPAMTDPMHIL